VGIKIQGEGRTQNRNQEGEEKVETRQGEIKNLITGEL